MAVSVGGTSPLPLPSHFSAAQQFFSLKKRSSSSRCDVAARPCKTCPALSRVFSRRPAPWTPLSRSLTETPPLASLYDPSSPQSFFSQCFINLGLIGRGSYGDVFKVQSLADGRLYAVKCLSHQWGGARERSRRVSEARRHEELHPHAHVLGFVAAWEEAEHLYIQTELCRGSLLSHAGTASGSAPPAPPPREVWCGVAGESCAWRCLCDVLPALLHLHGRGLVHLDVKPANVFVSECGRLKLGDFGLVTQLGDAQEAELQEGDPRYMAPELLRGQCGAAADIFSLGVSVLELACDMEVPTGGGGWQQLRQGRLPAPLASGLSAELRDVLRWMLTPDPRLRPSAAQLLSLPPVCTRLRRRRLLLRVRECVWPVLRRGQALLRLVWSLLLHFVPASACTSPATPSRAAAPLQYRGVTRRDTPPSDPPGQHHLQPRNLLQMFEQTEAEL